MKTFNKKVAGFSVIGVLVVVVVLVVGGVMFSVVSRTQAISAVTAGPNAAGVVVLSPFGAKKTTSGVDWVNPSSAQNVGDDVFTSVTLPKSKNSSYLVAKNFGFSLPSDATITGIRASFDRTISGTGGPAANAITDNAVRIVQGGVIGATEGSGGVAWAVCNGECQNLTANQYGNSSYLWGLTWTPTQVNASDFGVALSAQNTSGGKGVTQNALVDAMYLTVYYTVPSVAGTVSKSQTLSVRQ